MTQTGDIRVMIVDDHQMVREGLKVLLSTSDGIVVVGEAATAPRPWPSARPSCPTWSSWT